MILGNNNISTYTVGTAIGSSSRDVGTLCTSSLINMWSKWKPIESPVETMTAQELERNRYGLKILESNTLDDLIRQIKNNSNIGVTYAKPKIKYRLGDFRNYNSTAPVTVETSKELYVNGTVNIGGVTANNHASYEKLLQGAEAMGTDTTIGVEDLYHFIDINGQDIVVRRGAYVTDGTHSEWYTDKLYWWTNEMQYFKGTTVDVYEFYTNAKKTPSDFYQQNANDRFYALPMPYFQLKVEDKTPAGSKIVATMLNSQFTSSVGSSSLYENVSYNVYFDAKGEIYRGGDINNIWVKLCRDRDGYDVIEQKKLEDKLYVEDETQSKHYLGIFKNRPLNPYTPPSENVWVIIWWNNTLQTRQMPMMERPDIQKESYILRPEDNNNN